VTPAVEGVLTVCNHELAGAIEASGALKSRWYLQMLERVKPKSAPELGSAKKESSSTLPSF
jgi:hypothetical protein